MSKDNTGACNDCPRYERHCTLCESDEFRHHEQKTLETGSWVTLVASLDDDGRMFLFASAEDNTDRYYPRFCPECGRELQTYGG